MREIKFRVFNSAENETGEVYSIDKIYINYISKYPEPETMCRVSRCELILMQYTGLKDKNGVEVYEGDILTSSSIGRSKAKVIYEAPYFKTESLEKKGVDYPTLVYGNLEVIGNIYENPELLNV